MEDQGMNTITTDELTNDNTPSSSTNIENLQHDSKDFTPPSENDCLNLPNLSSPKLNEETPSKIDEIAKEAISESGDRLNDNPSLPLTPPANNTSTSDSNNSQIYRLKVISWEGRRVQIVTQNENGPCPLIAIINVLLLRRRIFLPPEKRRISSEELIAHIGNQLLENTPQDLREPIILDYQQNMQDAINIIPRLNTGLDVNIRFTGVQDFEYTPECIIFDLLNIPLYHGWLVDPQAKETVKAISNLGYNQLVEKIIANRASDNTELATEAFIAEQFLEKTASQLTYHGLLVLYETMKHDELAVFFRNNHFSTILKTKNELFQLVTDQGFLHEKLMVWETISNIDGAGFFVDSFFSSSPFKTNQSYSISAPSTHQHRQQNYRNTNPSTSQTTPTTSRNTTTITNNRRKEMTHDDTSLLKRFF